MTVISKYLIFSFFSIMLFGCSTAQKHEPLFVINVGFTDKTNQNCSLNILTEAKQKAKVTSQTKTSTCQLSAKVRKVDGDEYKLSINFKHIKNGAIVSEISPTFDGVFDQPFIYEKSNLKNNLNTGFTATVSKTTSL